MILRISILFLFLASLSSGQEKLFKGTVVLDNDENESLSDILVENLRSGFAVKTDSIGSFEVFVAKGDSIKFSSFFIEERKIQISTYFYLAENPIIHLTPKTIELAEARIWNSGLSGFLGDDLNQINESIPEDSIRVLYEKLGVNPDIEPTPDIAPPTFWDYFPLTMSPERLYDIISGDLRRRRTLYSFDKREKTIIEIREYFGDDYFTETLKIPKGKIRDLIVYAYTNKDLDKKFKNNNFLESMKILEESAKEIKNRLGSD